MNNIQSLLHPKFMCQYHIVFAPKYRRKEIYGKIKADIGVILGALCKQKNVEIIESEARHDHIHMLVSIPLQHNYFVIIRDLFGYLFVE